MSRHRKAERRKPPKRLPEIYDPKEGRFLNTRLWVGQECEVLFREANEAKRNAAINEASTLNRKLERPASVLSLVKCGAPIEIDTDKAAAGKATVNLVTELCNARGVVERRVTPGVVRGVRPRGHPAMLINEGSEGLVVLRAFPVVVAKPYGTTHADIVAAVQAKILEQFGIPMSVAWVKKCWQEYRKLEKRLRTEND